MIGDLYAQALAGASAQIEYLDGTMAPLNSAPWFRLDAADQSLLSACSGPTLDIGSGPGRLTTALTHRGHYALGIDITPSAVALTRRAGGRALLRDVFDDLPGTGRWSTALLADGNLGIGGHPQALLARMRQLLRPGGAVLTELAPPGVTSRVDRVRLRCGELTGDWFAWATVSVTDITRLAGAAGFPSAQCWSIEQRWLARLT
ncbi:class I SAM-dependent methyltransferase [Nonomuraea sp. NBC_01738]|uniref:class I SAM-dependent methyltransferase n=1 Tax=Nonomuraea sp. NBC_01738 TaxID=2976003 RepID=UPI002E0E6551|nr:class I SAM-dependent methyltransferase [Nonomuraea sp. NBC_01738]